MKRQLTMGSLFDGSGGFPLASVLSGITPVWASEIEPFPIRVTTKRLPNMKHYGDVSAISGAEVPPVDIITFGSPCQDLSTANGNRQGLAGSRSGLFLEAIRIIKEMREATNGVYPTVAVFENVPGAFSANKGEDFRRVLEEFAHIRDESVSIPRPAGGKWPHAGEIVADGWSLAWRCLDACGWGVPQRRLRIFLVAHLGGMGAGKILFDRESLLGNPFKSASARQGTPTGTGRRADETGDLDANVLSADESEIMTQTNGVCIPLEDNGSRPSHQGDGYGQAGDPAYTLNTVEQHAVCYNGAGCEGGQTTYTLTGDHDNRVTDRSNLVATATVYDAQRRHDYRAFDGVCIPLEGNGARPSHQGDGYGQAGDPAYTLNTVEQHAVCYRKSARAQSSDDGETWVRDEKSNTLNTFDLGDTRTSEAIVYNNHPNDSRVTGTSGGVLDTLSSQMGTGGNNTPLVRVPLSFQERAGCAGGGKGILIQENKTGALCAAQTQAVLTEGGAMAFDGYNGSVSGECPTLGVNCGMSTGRNGVMVKDDVQR